MKGLHHIVVQNNKLHYELNIKRNITIIRGDSATGKTSLIEMLSQYSNLGEDSGISLVCDCPIQVVSGRNWKIFLSVADNQIIFIDEEQAFIKTEEFASIVRKSTCYCVLITREDLPNLPYSAEEIYGFHSSGRYQNTRRIYNEMYRLYSPLTGITHVDPQMILVEDSNAGFDFFNALSADKSILCKSAHGKSNLAKMAAEKNDDKVLIIGDGAAIGPEMSGLYQLMNRQPDICCYLPESFEWLILQSGLIDGNEIQNILERPEDYIESSQFFSWEQFFLPAF